MDIYKIIGHTVFTNTVTFQMFVRIMVAFLKIALTNMTFIYLFIFKYCHFLTQSQNMKHLLLEA